MIRALFKDMAKYLPAQIIPGIVGIVSLPIVTRLFSPSDYGNYVLVIATVSVLSIIIGWVSMAIIRFYPLYERDNKTSEFYSTVIKLTAISITVILGLFSIILLIIKNNITQELYSLLKVGTGVFVLMSVFDVLQHCFRAKRMVGWYSGFFAWKSISSLIFGLLLVIFLKLGIEGLLWGSVLSIAFISPILWKKAIGTVYHGEKISRERAVEMAKYGFPLVIGNLAAWILSLSDRYMLEFFRDSSEVGIYSASYNIAEHSVMLLATLFMLASGPLGVHIWEKEGKEKSKEFVSKVTRFFLIICVPAVVGLSVLSKPIIDVLVSKNYSAGYRIIPFVAIGAFFLGLQQRYQSGFIFYKKTGCIMFSMVLAGIINLALNFILIPHYGYIAAAFTTLISYVFLFLIMTFLSRRFFVWEFPFKTLAKVSLASAVMGVVVYPIGNSLTSSVPINLILGIFIGIVVYTVMLFVLREPRTEEVRVIQAAKAIVFKRLKW